MKHYLTYEVRNTYQFVFFGIETTSIGKNVEICQLSAVTENGKTYSTFIMPNDSVSPSASRVNKLTFENVNGKRTLCKNSYSISTASLQAALKSFSTFLHQYSFERNKNNVVTVLIGHNSSIFDVPTLLRNADASFVNQLNEININFGDTLPLIRSLLQRKHSPLQQTNGELCKANQSSVYQCLLQQEFDAHDALEDVLA